jgi:ubiquinone/menaquinone biosynthesis C-methylase UbiE
MRDDRRMRANKFRYHARVLLLALLASHCSTVPAEELNVNPDINRHYQNPEFERWVTIFESPGREVYDRREAIVEALALEPGMVVADIGAGTGLFSLMFSPRVGATGSVYAVDISRTFIDNILRRARGQDMKNVIGIVSDQKDTRLPPTSIDLAFICDTYHHFEFPQTMLASIQRALRPGGRLVIIDFRKQPAVSTAWVMSHVRADKTIVTDEVTRAGFRLIADRDILTRNYYLEFEKHPQPVLRRPDR